MVNLCGTLCLCVIWPRYIPFHLRGLPATAPRTVLKCFGPSYLQFSFLHYTVLIFVFVITLIVIEIKIFFIDWGGGGGGVGCGS